MQALVPYGFFDTLECIKHFEYCCQFREEIVRYENGCNGFKVGDKIQVCFIDMDDCHLVDVIIIDFNVTPDEFGIICYPSSPENMFGTQLNPYIAGLLKTNSLSFPIDACMYAKYQDNTFILQNDYKDIRHGYFQFGFRIPKAFNVPESTKKSLQIIGQYINRRLLR